MWPNIFFSFQAKSYDDVEPVTKIIGDYWGPPGAPKDKKNSKSLKNPKNACKWGTLKLLMWPNIFFSFQAKSYDDVEPVRKIIGNYWGPPGPPMCVLNR